MIHNNSWTSHEQLMNSHVQLCNSQQHVLNKLWSICEVMNKQWTNFEELLGTSHEKFMHNIWTIFDQVMNNSWTSHEKSWINLEQIMEQSRKGL